MFNFENLRYQWTSLVTGGFVFQFGVTDRPQDEMGSVQRMGLETNFCFQGAVVQAWCEKAGCVQSRIPRDGKEGEDGAKQRLPRIWEAWQELGRRADSNQPEKMVRAMQTDSCSCGSLWWAVELWGVKGIGAGMEVGKAGPIHKGLPSHAKDFSFLLSGIRLRERFHTGEH